MTGNWKKKSEYIACIGGQITTMNVTMLKALPSQLKLNRWHSDLSFWLSTEVVMRGGFKTKEDFLSVQEVEEWVW
jgi:hypothetical protein